MSKLTTKGCLLVGGFMIVVFACLGIGFAILLHYLFSHEEDQSYLTEHVSGKVLRTRDLTEEYGVVFSYTVNGRTYYDRVNMNERGWHPGDGVDVCVDPKHPIRHAVTDGISEWCGSKYLYTGTSNGLTTPPSL